MKTTIKLLSIGLIVSQILFTACKGPAGPIGPAGPQGNNGQNGAAGLNGKDGQNGATGAIGPTGVAGANGKDGNANVIQYTYATARLATSGEIEYTVTGITQSQLNNSLVFVYVISSLNPTIWYALPGYSANGNNQYRVYMNPNKLSVFLNRSSGTVTETFNSTRILVVPANDLRNGRKPAIDYSDYEAVKKYYNLKD